MQGIVLHSLVYKNTFSSRPLVEFLINNIRKVRQIWSDGFLYEGIRFREQYISGKVVTFRINQTFYWYENYTLKSTSTQINQLVPSLLQVHYEYTPVDFAKALNLFPAHNDRYNDIQNMLLSLSQLQEDCQYVRKFLASNTDSNSEADFEYIDNSITKTMKNVFLSVIISITDPILSGIITVLIFLSLFWSVVLTILACKYIFRLELLNSEMEKPMLAVQESLLMQNFYQIMTTNCNIVSIQCILSNAKFDV